MSIDDFLSGEWIKKLSTFPNLPLEKENIIITREPFVLTMAEIEKMEYLIRESSSNQTKRADEVTKKDDIPSLSF